MKKIIAIILSLCVIFGLVGCGVSTETPADTTEKVEVIEFKEQVLINNESVTFKVTDAPEKDEIWGQLIDVYLENKTDKTLMYSLENVSVNGYMVNVLFATEVTGGKKENTSITIFSDDLDKNKIDKIETITFTLRIYDANDWEADPIVDNVEYTVNFN